MRLWLLVGLAGCERVLSLPPVPPPDGTGSGPAFVQAAVWVENTLDTPQIDYSVTLSAPADLCIVTVGLDGTGPTVASVTYAGMPMNELISVRGVTGTSNTMNPFTDQWWLAAPDLPSGDVIVTMGVAGSSAQVSALFFAGARQTQPFRDMRAASGFDDHMTMQVTTSPGDLVESVTGQGSGVGDAGEASNEVFVHNVDATTALNNSGGSVTPAIGPSTAIAWQYTGADLFQTVAAAIEPASR